MIGFKRNPDKQPERYMRRELSPEHPFLAVIQEFCAKDTRYTLTADSGGHKFVVLTDRGGPFNVSGGGLEGGQALTVAANLRAGTCTIEPGWPTMQPMYQLGLDVVMEGLTGGTLPADPGLPPVRGSGMHAPMTQSPTQATPMTAAPRRLDDMPMAPLPAPPAQAMAPVQQPLPSGPAVLTATAPFAPQASAEPLVDLIAGMRASVTTMAPPAATVIAPAPFAPPAPTEPPITMPPVAAAPSSSTPVGAPTVSQAQGAVRHALTQALLWVVQAEDPGRYTLGQAWALLRTALVEEVGFQLTRARQAARVLLHRTVLRHWHSIKSDWEKSGEVVKRQSRRKQPSPR